MPKPELKALFRENHVPNCGRTSASAFCSPEQIIVVAGQVHAHFLQEQYPAIPAQNYVLLEPEGRGVLLKRAVGLAAIHLAKRDPEARMAVLTADHAIGDTETFRSAIAAHFSGRGRWLLVTLGIHATEASTQYGYIEAGAQLMEAGKHLSYQVERFVEKPPGGCRKNVSPGNYSWNSGMFIWRLQDIMARVSAPDARTLCGLLEKLAACIGTPDYQADRDCEWLGKTDFGLWHYGGRKTGCHDTGKNGLAGHWQFWQFTGNAQGMIRQQVSGDVLLGDCEGSMVLSTGKRLVAAIGLQDLVVIDTPEVVLVCPKERAAEVRKLVAKLAGGSSELI